LLLETNTISILLWLEGCQYFTEQPSLRKSVIGKTSPNNPDQEKILKTDFKIKSWERIYIPVKHNFVNFN
jgi:hypothetical protein